MKRVKASVSNRTYAKFERRVMGLRHYHYIREATQYLWESEFECCRKLLRKLSEVLDISYEDMTFLFADELFEACSKGDLEEKKKIIHDYHMWEWNFPHSMDKNPLPKSERASKERAAHALEGILNEARKNGEV